MYYVHYRADGTEAVIGSLKKIPPLSDLQKYVGGYVSILKMPNGDTLYCNDEGKLEGLPVNDKATAIFKELFPKEKYPINNDELIVGDVLYAKRELAK